MLEDLYRALQAYLHRLYKQCYHILGLQNNIRVIKLIQGFGDGVDGGMTHRIP